MPVCTYRVGSVHSLTRSFSIHLTQAPYLGRYCRSPAIESRLGRNVDPRGGEVQGPQLENMADGEKSAELDTKTEDDSGQFG